MLQLIVSGIIFGCIYGLTAIGLVLIYKTTDIVNFSHGEMSMIISFMAFMFFSTFHMSYLSFFIVASLFAALLGAAIYLIFLRPIQSASPLSQIVLTLGLYMALHGLAGLIWGHTPTSFPKARPGSSFEIGSIYITPNDIFIVTVTLIIMLVFFWILRYTKLGLAMRTASQDLITSKLMGINVTVIFIFVWIMGAVLGGVAGMLIAPTTYLQPTMMSEILIMAFASAVLGGFVSFPGAVIGGMIVGVFGNLVSFYVGPELRVVFVFILILLILFIRPTGLFGGNQYVKKV